MINSKRINRAVVWTILFVASSSAPLLRHAHSMAHTPTRSVSIIQLIADPEKYNGRRVHLIGYARVAFEDDRIYLRPEDDEYGITDNGINIAIKTLAQDEAYRSKDKKYALIEGTFDGSRMEIGDITRFEVCTAADETPPAAR